VREAAPFDKVLVNALGVATELDLRLDPGTVFFAGRAGTADRLAIYPRRALDLALAGAPFSSGVEEFQVAAGGGLWVAAGGGRKNFIFPMPQTAEARWSLCYDGSRTLGAEPGVRDVVVDHAEQAGRHSDAGRINGFVGFLKSRMEAGQFRAIIDRKSDLAAIADAYRYVETGQKVGIVVINVAAADESAHVA